MRAHFLFAALGLGLLQVSCSVVLTKTHIADRTEDPLQEKLEGSWQNEDGVIQIAFDEAGTGWAAWVDWDDEAFSLSQARFQAKQFGDAFLLTAEEVEGDPEEAPEGHPEEAPEGHPEEAPEGHPEDSLEGHMLIRFEVLDSGELHFYPPDVKAIAALVDEKTIDGSVTRGKHSIRVLLEDVRPAVEKLGPLEKAFPGGEDETVLRRLPEWEDE